MNIMQKMKVEKFRSSRSKDAPEEHNVKKKQQWCKFVRRKNMKDWLCKEYVVKRKRWGIIVDIVLESILIGIILLLYRKKKI